MTMANSLDPIGAVAQLNNSPEGFEQYITNAGRPPVGATGEYIYWEFFDHVVPMQARAAASTYRGARLLFQGGASQGFGRNVTVPLTSGKAFENRVIRIEALFQPQTATATPLDCETFQDIVFRMLASTRLRISVDQKDYLVTNIERFTTVTLPPFIGWATQPAGSPFFTPSDYFASQMWNWLVLNPGVPWTQSGGTDYTLEWDIQSAMIDTFNPVAPNFAAAPYTTAFRNVVFKIICGGLLSRNTK